MKSIDEIILATTNNISDNVLIEEAARLEIRSFRGKEENVMDRVIRAGDFLGADVIVEITGDCPIIDPNIIQRSISIFESYKYDYVANVLAPSYPDGMATQVLFLGTLKKSYMMTNERLDREHVTLHIRNNPEIFSQFNMQAPSNMFWPGLGLTLDEELDYYLIKNIIEHFGEANNLFGCDEVISYLKGNPELIEINKTVVRKGNT